MSHKKLAMLFIVTSLFTFAIYTADAQMAKGLAIVEKGLASYWTLDKIKKSPTGEEIVEDIVGENDGIVRGKPKTVEGKYDNALEFDGIKDFILLPTNKWESTHDSNSLVVSEKKGLRRPVLA